MGEVIGETKSLCPVCLSVIDAYRMVEDNNVYLVKECPEHGLFKVIVWHDAKYYKDVKRYSHPKVEPIYIKETSYEKYPKIWDPEAFSNSPPVLLSSR